MRRTFPDLTQYLREVARTPVLPDPEVKQLVRLAQGGCCDSRNRVVTANLRLVVAVVNRLTSRTCDSLVDDMVQEGNLGLAHAVDTYDERFNTKFTTHAVWWIENYAGRVLHEPPIVGVVHVPAYIISIRAKRMRDDGPEPCDGGPLRSPITKGNEKCYRAAEIAITAERLSVNAQKERSDDNYSSGEIPDYRTPDVELEDNQDDLTKLMAALDVLEPRQRRVLELRFGIGGPPMSLAEAGEVLGVSKERVRQIQVKATVRLRREMCCAES